MKHLTYCAGKMVYFFILKKVRTDTETEH